MTLYKDAVFGAIRGLDRIRFRGTLRWLANEAGLRRFLWRRCILLKDFKDWAMGITGDIRTSCQRRADELGIETHYLNSSRLDKEAMAHKVASEKGITHGAICNLSIVEECMAPVVRGNRAAKKLELKMARRKCIWLYHYFDHPEFGFGHVRLQTWVPFNLFICLNGRHWLERQLQKHAVAYVKDGNCFPWIEDVAAAQELMDRQLETHWAAVLNGLGHRSGEHK